jgi:FtsH-binding integral membrane protein
MQRVGEALSDVSAQTLFRMGHTDRRVQSHLIQVYALLACASVSASTGALSTLLTQLNQSAFFPPLVSIATLASVVYIAYTRNGSGKRTQRSRIAALLTAGFCFGSHATSVMAFAAAVDPSIPPKALLGTASVFVSFSLSALLARRRSLLFLGGIAGTLLNTLMLLRFAKLLGVGASVYDANIFVGLAVFLLYTIADTQAIIERANALELDPVCDALTLLIDAAGVLTRLALALTRSKTEKQSRKRRTQ